MPGGDARSELHLHRTACPVAICKANTPGGSMELQSALTPRPQRGAPARPCSSGHRTEETPTLFCAIGSPCPEQSAMVCRPLVHTSHSSMGNRQLLSEGQLRVLTTVQCYTNGHPHFHTYSSFIWCALLSGVLCLSNETLCPMMPPSDANPRNKSPRQPASPEGLHSSSLLRLGPPQCSTSLDPTITIGRGRSIARRASPRSLHSGLAAWEFSMQD